jgi:hypothetical protein
MLRGFSPEKSDDFGRRRTRDLRYQRPAPKPLAKGDRKSTKIRVLQRPLFVFVTFLLHAAVLTNPDECETLRPMINSCVYSDDVPGRNTSYLNQENVQQTALKHTLSLPLRSAQTHTNLLKPTGYEMLQQV